MNPKANKRRRGMKVSDCNGNTVIKNVKKEEKGWGATVWFGGINGIATDIRRYYYDTKKAASNADISNDIGQQGRVA